MSEIFGNICKLSILTCFLIIAVMILRILLKRAPRWIICLLWGVVAIRLVLPVTIESRFSLVPSSLVTWVDTFAKTYGTQSQNQDMKAMVETEDHIDKTGIQDEGVLQGSEGIQGVEGNQGIERIKSAGVSQGIDGSQGTLIGTETIQKAEGVPETEALQSKEAATLEDTTLNENEGQMQRSNGVNIGWILEMIWIAGVIGMILYAISGYNRMRRKVADATRVEDNVLECDNISDPFILGMFRPMIYLPARLTGSEKRYILDHEKAHLSRGDQFWKPVGFALLSVYWFHPLMWFAYYLFCKDIEIACDEKATYDLNRMERSEYCQTLLNLSTNDRGFCACPLAFGEVGAKTRIKAILSYKKPSFIRIAISMVLCIAVGGCFFADPKTLDQQGIDAAAENVELENSEKDDAKIDIKSLLFTPDGEINLEFALNHPEYVTITPVDRIKMSDYSKYSWISRKDASITELMNFSISDHATLRVMIESNGVDTDILMIVEAPDGEILGSHRISMQYVDGEEWLCLEKDLNYCRMDQGIMNHEFCRYRLDEEGKVHCRMQSCVGTEHEVVNEFKVKVNKPDEELDLQDKARLLLGDIDQNGEKVFVLVYEQENNGEKEIMLDVYWNNRRTQFYRYSKMPIDTSEHTAYAQKGKEIVYSLEAAFVRENREYVIMSETIPAASNKEDFIRLGSFGTTSPQGFLTYE